MWTRFVGTAATFSIAALRKSGDVKNLSEQLLTVSMAQGFAVLPIHQGEAYPGLKVIPLGDEFTEHAVLAYRQDGMTEALQHFLTFFAGMP